MHASDSIGRVGGLALALGVGAILAYGGAGVACAAPGDDVDSSAVTADAGPRSAPPSRTGTGPTARSARPPAARSVRVAAVTSMPATAMPIRTAAVVGSPTTSVVARSQPIAPAAALASTQTGSRSAAATAGVNPIAAMFFNQTPTMSPTVISSTPGGAVTGQLNGSDPDSAPLSYTVVTPPAHGSVSVDGSGTYTYSPDPSMARAGYLDSFTVSISDESTGFHIHGLMGLLSMLTFGLLGESGHTSRQTVSVIVSGTNVAPIATAVVNNPDLSTGVVTGSVIASDAEGDPLSFATFGGSKGTAVISNTGAFTYTPTWTARHQAASLTATSADLSDAFAAVVSDGFGGTTTVPVSVPIVPVNNAPTGSSAVGVPDATTGLVAGAILGSDADSDPLSYSATSAANGTVILNPDGSFTYSPLAQARHNVFFSQGPTTDAFDVTITDGYGGTTTVPVQVDIAPAGVTFSFTWDSFWNSRNQAKTALNSAARSLSSYFVVDAPTTITVNATGTNAPSSNNLAYASTNFTGGGPGFYATVVQGKILTGVDANGGSYDASINVNFGQSWDYTDPISGSQYDFKAVAIHELLHTVGFLTGSEAPGSQDGNWSIYDRFLTTFDGTSVFLTNDPTTLDPQYVANFTDPTPNNPNNPNIGYGIYFTGPNAGRVRLYTPNPWESGSSVSHVNELGAGWVMNPILGTGLGTRELNPVEVGILKDIGYQVSTSPWVPAFVIVFVRLRRRRR